MYVLLQTQNQAMHDQEEDMKEISNMKAKFEKLIQLYSEAQQSIDKNSNNKNSKLIHYNIYIILHKYLYSYYLYV